MKHIKAIRELLDDLPSSFIEDVIQECVNAHKRAIIKECYENQVFLDTQAIEIRKDFPN